MYKNKLNKKIIIALFFSFIMIAGIGLVLFNGSNIHVNAKPDTVNSSTLNECNVSIGATNSGLTVPVSDLGYSGHNGSALTLSSDSGLPDVTSDSGYYTVSGSTLTVTNNATITGKAIPYAIVIDTGVKLTLQSDCIGEVTSGNSFSNGQLIINDSRITSTSGVTNPQSISVYLNNSITEYSRVNILGGNNDTFDYDTSVRITGTLDTSFFDYPALPSGDFLSVIAESNNAIIKNSYLPDIYGSLNSEPYLLHIEHSTLSFSTSYVDGGLFQLGQYTEENVNLSYDIFAPLSSSSPYYSLVDFEYSQYYDDYYNFTMPQSVWSNQNIVNDTLNIAWDYGADNYKNSRGLFNLNDTLYPVYIQHNEFAGLDGIEVYGTGNAYIENNIITEQNFETAYLGFFEHTSSNTHQTCNFDLPLQNSVIANNTFYYYSNQQLANYIEDKAGVSGGNTYITSGETANMLQNVSVIHNSFIGALFTAHNDDGTYGHASFLLGAYQYIKYNYFDATTNFNGGNTFNSPDVEIDYYQNSNTANFSYNYFYGLNSNVVAIAFAELGSGSTYGTINLYANEYKGYISPYQITAAQGYTINSIVKNNYQHLTLNGTVTMYYETSPYTYTANSYAINNVSIVPISSTVSTQHYNVEIKEIGLIANTSWTFTFNGTSYTLTGNSYNISVLNGTYSLSVSSVKGYTDSYNSTIIVNGANVTEDIYFTTNTKIIGTGSYLIQININNPNGIYYTLILDKNGNTTSYNLSSTLILIHTNNTNFPLSVEFINLKSGYSISIPQIAYYKTGNYVLNENIIDNNGNPEYITEKYFPEIAIAIIIMGILITGAVLKRRG